MQKKPKRIENPTTKSCPNPLNYPYKSPVTIPINYVPSSNIPKHFLTHSDNFLADKGCLIFPVQHYFTDGYYRPHQSPCQYSSGYLSIPDQRQPAVIAACFPTLPCSDHTQRKACGHIHIFLTATCLPL